jgi:hypothetical protein
MSNSKRFPEAWKIYIDCVRKWKVPKDKQFPTGWKYGIPNPESISEYLYSDCPGKLFMKFKAIFYRHSEIGKFRTFLWKLEMMEGKITRQQYESNIQFMQLG